MKTQTVIQKAQKRRRVEQMLSRYNRERDCATRTDTLILKDSRRANPHCWQLVNERTGVVYADIYSDGLAEMIAAHNYKVMS